MPIYEFECEECGRVVEHLFTTKEAKVLTFLECGKCGGRMKKLISVPSDPIIHGFNAENSYSHTKNKKKKKED